MGAGPRPERTGYAGAGEPHRGGHSSGFTAVAGTQSELGLRVRMSTRVIMAIPHAVQLFEPGFPGINPRVPAKSPLPNSVIRQETAAQFNARWDNCDGSDSDSDWSMSRGSNASGSEDNRG